MRTTLLIFLALLNTSLFSQSRNTKAKIIQSDNSSTYSSISFKEISALRNYYDYQHGGTSGTPVQIWQDPVNPNNIHAVYTFSASWYDGLYPDRTVKYYFSSDRGITWSFITNLSPGGYKSGFGSITGLSNGSALIILHTNDANGIVRTKIYADAFPGLGSFVTLDPGGNVSNKYIWPQIIATNSVNSTNKFVFMAASISEDSSFINTGTSLTANNFTGYKFLTTAKDGYAIGRGTDGRIGVAYVANISPASEKSDLYFMESTNDGTTFSTPLKIYNCDFAVDSMISSRGISIVYQNNTPKIVFATAKLNSWWNRPSKIRFWTPTLSGSDPNRSIIIGDENNIPCNFPPTDYFDSPETPFCFPSIGTSADNNVLFCSIETQSSQVGGIHSINYNDIYLTRSYNGGTNWLTPERITPLTPRNDWTYASISPTNDFNADTYFVNLMMQKDTSVSIGINGTGGYDTTTNAHPYFVRVGFARAASPPGPPSLIFPGNGATNVALTPDMSWSANGLNYRLQVSTNSSFSTLVLEQSNINFAHYQITAGNLNSNTLYYWRVASSNEFGEGGYSSVYSFTTTSQSIPLAPTLISPVGGITNVQLNPTLDWNDVSGASTYRALVSDDKVFSNIILDSGSISSSLVNVPFNLFPLRKYYWKVCATNTAGTGVFSGVDSFTIADLAPPTLISPSDSALTIVNVPISWATVQAADWYNYQISEFLDFHNFIYNNNSSNPAVAINNLPIHSKWYWRIRAVADNGLGLDHYGPFSTIRSFTTAISPPTLISPTNGQQGVLLNPTLVWNSVAGRTHYSFMISRNVNFTDTAYSSTSDTTFFVLPTNTLEINTLYYWKVRSQDSVGFGIYSAPWSFRSRLTGNINMMSEIIPSDYKLFSNYPNPFNPTTKIKFDLPKSSFVKINVFDITGKMINEIVNMNLNAGSYETEFNGSNLSSGIYYYRIEAGNFVETKKMILIK